jgi:hypothetical protein
MFAGAFHLVERLHHMVDMVENRIVDMAAGSMDLAADMGTIPCFVLIGFGMVDYEEPPENVLDNGLDSRNSFAPSIHDLDNDLIYFYQTWANISSAFSLLQTMLEGDNGCIFANRFQCQNEGDFV